MIFSLFSLGPPAKPEECAYCGNRGTTVPYFHLSFRLGEYPRLCSECWLRATDRENRERADAALERAWQANRKRPEY
jgi:hypothetical protein